MLKALVVISCFLLNACMMVGPNYKEPSTSIDKHWLKNNSAITEKPQQNVTWWHVFHDKNLTALIHQGYYKNLSIQSAGVRVLQARAQLAQIVGNLYPQQQELVGNYNYNRIGGGTLQTLLPQSFDTASLGFSANWEIDFWGKYRRAIQSNDASFLASLAAYDNALVTLTADIAHTYINIRVSEELIKVTKENIKLQTMSLQLAMSRFKNGQTSLLDVEEAKTELYETQATLPPLIAKLQNQKDALGVLLGTTPNHVDKLLLKTHSIPQAPLTVAIGIPKETIARRPDIYQARLEAMAQSEAIGAAKANLYPSFSLLGTFAFSSSSISPSSISNIFQWQNRTITAGPSVTWPLLNYGQITNAVRVQDAIFEQSLLNYLNIVLKAQQEVQDNITAYIEAKKAQLLLGNAVNAAIKSTHIALIRYREGQSDYTTVLDVERQQLRVQTSLVNAQGDVPKSLVELYRSLGGGWQIRKCNDIVPSMIKKEMAARSNWGDLLKQYKHQSPATRNEELKQLYLPNW